MPSASKLLFALAPILVGCGGQHNQQAQNQDMAIEDNVATGQIPPGAEIETLPPDESSETSSGELARGDDNPDVNVSSNSD